MAVDYKDYYKILGVNLAGIEVILRLLKRLDAIHQELEQERNRVQRRDSITTARIVMELSKHRKEYRR
jgi:hypothetical protein